MSIQVFIGETATTEELLRQYFDEAPTDCPQCETPESGYTSPTSDTTSYVTSTLASVTSTSTSCTALQSGIVEADFEADSPGAPVAPVPSSPDLAEEPLPHIHWKYYLILCSQELTAIRKAIGAPSPLDLP